MNVFISQPMRGRSEEEILAERKALIRRAEERFGDVEVIDSYFADHGARTPLENLGESLKLLAQADVAYFAPGWETARGCRIENECAIEYGIDVVEVYGGD